MLSFAHRGARAHAPENTIEAFETALAMGATGLESDVWVTADGIAVLDHDGVFGPRLRRRKIADTERHELPAHIPTMAELLALTPAVPISLDVNDDAAFDPVIEVAREHGPQTEERLWLCHPDPEVLSQWRPKTVAKLVNSVRLARIDEGLERRLARLHHMELDALNMFHSDWNGGSITLVHRFGLYAFGWGAQHEREIAGLLDAGIDAVYSDHVDRMVAVEAQYY